MTSINTKMTVPLGKNLLSRDKKVSHFSWGKRGRMIMQIKFESIWLIDSLRELHALECVFLKCISSAFQVAINSYNDHLDHFTKPILRGIHLQSPTSQNTSKIAKICGIEWDTLNTCQSGKIFVKESGTTRVGCMSRCLWATNSRKFANRSRRRSHRITYLDWYIINQYNKPIVAWVFENVTPNPIFKQNKPQIMWEVFVKLYKVYSCLYSLTLRSRVRLYVRGTKQKWSNWPSGC